MAIETFTIQIEGTRPLLQHNARLSDKLDPIVKQMSLLTAKRTKRTDEDDEMLAYLEWQGSLYLSEGEKGHPVLPGENFHRALVDAARKTKEGKTVQEGVSIETINADLIYDGPTDIASLYRDKNFVFRKSVKVGMSRIIRTRPIFTSWSATFDIAFDTEVLDKTDIIRFAEKAGAYIGIGDWRPLYGRFIAKEVN